MSKRAKRIVLGAGVLLPITGGGMWALAGDGRGLDGMKKVVRTRFPSVQQISTGELSAWLKDGRKSQPLVLDVRTQAEFDVSHLPGARRVEPDTKAADVLPLLENNRPVVTYCSVGGDLFELEPQCAPGKVLDVNAVSTVNGGNVHIWTTFGGGNQRWSLLPQ